MEVDPIPADLVALCTAGSRLCPKKGARRTGKIWPHPRLYRRGTTFSPVGRYAWGWWEAVALVEPACAWLPAITRSFPLSPLKYGGASSAAWALPPHPALPRCPRYSSGISLVLFSVWVAQHRRVTLRRRSAANRHPVLGTTLTSRVCRTQRIKAFLRSLLLK